MKELPDKFEVDKDYGFSNISTSLIVAKMNNIIDYLEIHTLPKEVKSWAYTFLGDSANIRCGEEIKNVQIFQGDKRYEFIIPD